MMVLHGTKSTHVQERQAIDDDVEIGTEMRPDKCT